MRVSRMLFAAAVALAMGCTAILGDFSVSNSPPPKDDGGVDTSVEAGPDSFVPKPIACKEAANVVSPRVKIATLVESSPPDRVTFYTFNDGQNYMGRVVITDTFNNILLYQLRVDDTKFPNPTLLDTVPTQGGQLMGTRRYPGGIAALFYSNSTLHIVTIGDKDTKWSPAIYAGQSGEFSNACNFQAALFAISASPPDFVVVVTYQDSACTTTNIKGLHVTGSGTVEQTWTPFAPKIRAAQDSIVVDANNVYVLVSRDDSGPPGPGSTPQLYTAQLSTMMAGPSTPLVLSNPALLTDVLAMAPSPIPGKVDVGFFGGDLSIPSISLWVGQTDLNKLSTLHPDTDLGHVPVGGVSELPVDKGRMHWEMYPPPLGSENLLAVSRASPGANFYWFDQRGNILAKQAGTTALFQNDQILGTDVNFSQKPTFPLLAQLMFTLVEPDGPAVDAGAPYTIWGVTVQCNN